MYCRTLKQLPKAGGVLDQDAYHMQLIRLALEAFAEREQKEHEEDMARHKARSRMR